MSSASERSAPWAQTGAIVAQRYEVVRPLGSGGMGSVLEAIDREQGGAVALKFLHRDLARDPVCVERFVREGQALARLEHPAIVRVRSCGPTEDGGLYLAMELVHGETLQRFLRRRAPMSVDALGPIVRDLALGLFYAHERGVVHRDLKPANVILVAGRDADTPSGATLIDFGVATASGMSRLTHRGEYVGTPRYMAPEQLAATASEDGRADLYSLGVVAYEALAGESPFPCDMGLGAMMGAVLRGEVVPLRARRPDLPPGLEQVIARAMARRPEHRFAHGLELLDAWDGAVRPLGRGAPATIPMTIVSTPPPSTRPPRHSVIRARPPTAEPAAPERHRAAGQHRAVIARTIAIEPTAPGRGRVPPAAAETVVPTAFLAAPPPASPRRGGLSPLHIALVAMLAALALVGGAGLVLVAWALLR